MISCIFCCLLLLVAVYLGKITNERKKERTKKKLNYFKRNIKENEFLFGYSVFPFFAFFHIDLQLI